VPGAREGESKASGTNHGNSGNEMHEVENSHHVGNSRWWIWTELYSEGKLLVQNSSRSTAMNQEVKN